MQREKQLDEVREEFRRLVRGLKRLNRRMPLKAGERAVLEALIDGADGQELTPSQVGAELEIPLPNLSPVIRSLEERGYLHRRHSSKDRRNVYLSPTDAGRAAYGECTAAMRGLFGGLLEELGAEDGRQLLKLLRQAADYFEGGR